MTWYKPEVDNSLQARQQRASAKVQSALDTFTDVADQLEEAVAENEDVIAEVSNEIDRLSLIGAAARGRADRAANAADKIRKLVS